MKFNLVVTIFQCIRVLQLNDNSASTSEAHSANSWYTSVVGKEYYWRLSGDAMKGPDKGVSQQSLVVMRLDHSVSVLYYADGHIVIYKLVLLISSKRKVDAIL
jgi:hypothetical protein